MTTADKKANEKILRDTFRTMDPHQAQEIREAYYKAIEGLRSLADALEIADAHLHIVGRICVDQLNRFASEQSIEVLGFR